MIWRMRPCLEQDPINFKEGLTGCMIIQNHKGDVEPLFLKDVEDERGKVRPRLVNIDSERVKLVFDHNLHYITQNDYKAARKYVDDPDEYDFKKILEW
jgi:hypothetical protein